MTDPLNTFTFLLSVRLTQTVQGESTSLLHMGFKPMFNLKICVLGGIVFPMQTLILQMYILLLWQKRPELNVLVYIRGSRAADSVSEAAIVAGLK